MRRIRCFGWSTLPVAVLLVSAGMAHAAATSVTAPARLHDNHAAPRVVNRLPGRLHLTAAKSGTYVYAEDGTCPDGIDVFQASGTGLTNIQNVQAGCSGGTEFGAHHLAVVKTPSDCLILSSDGEAGDDQGTVDSFTIDPSTGMLSTSPVSSAFVGGFPNDLAVSGSTVYESNSNYYNETGPTIDELTVGPGCSLTLDSQSSTGTEYDLNIAVLADGNVVSADENSGNMVEYVNEGDGLVETISDPGQISDPDGVATAGPYVFTGQLGNPAYAQGFKLSGGSFDPLPNSPQTTGGCDGVGASVSVPNRLLLQPDQCGGTISWYTIGTGGLLAGGAAALQNPDADPTEITVAGNIALVAQAYYGDLEACSLATSGVSDCRTVATLTGAGSGVSGSTAVF